MPEGLIVRSVTEDLHAPGGDEHLLLELQPLVVTLDADVGLHAEDHPVLDLPGVVVLEGDHRVLVTEAAAVRDEGVALRVIGGGQPSDRKSVV